MPAAFIMLLFFVQSLEDEVRAMRAEIQMLRDEVAALKREIAEPETLPLIQAQVEEHAQTKVESYSRFPMKIFGTIVSNTAFNRNGADWMDVPNVANASTSSFTSTMRQSRIGAILEGPLIGTAKLSGFMALDFFGGIPNFSTGPTMGIPRLLYAYARLDGERTALQIGQDHMILAPKNPTSLAAMSFPSLYRSGNLYLRVPHVRLEHTVAAGAGEVRAQVGVLAPISGDFNSASFQFVPPALAGERSQAPGLQGRMSWRSPQWELGAAGHYSRERGAPRSWASSVDFDVTAGRVGLGGEFFAGRNIDAFGGSVAQQAMSRGGFMEARIAAATKLSFNAGYGTDRLYGVRTAAVKRNSGAFGNFIYQFTPEFSGSLEYRRQRTRPAAGSDRTNDHFNLTFAYSF